MDWIQTLTIIGSTCGTLLYLRKEHREDLNRIDIQHREDVQIIREEIKTVREEIKATDNRWVILFEKFHILDKDVEKFKTQICKK